MTIREKTLQRILASQASVQPTGSMPVKILQSGPKLKGGFGSTRYTVVKPAMKPH